jgi:TonB family protein
VILECTLDREGRVDKTRVIGGPPPLTGAAVDAVSQWRYEPTELNGVAVPVLMAVTVKFKLETARHDLLLGSLSHESEHIREAAAHNLGTLRAGGGISEADVEGTIRALQPLAESDESARVRAAATQALSQLSSQRPSPSLAPEPPPPTPPWSPLAPVHHRRVAWGVFIDPLGKGHVSETGKEIRIGVPAGVYDLSIEIGQTTAPRVLQAVEGDFVAEVAVDRIPTPGPPTVGQERRGYHGAGLLLWVNERSYVRLESAAYRSGDSAVRYALFEVRSDGELAGGLSPAHHRLRDDSARLRLERQGRGLRALVRQKNDAWVEVGRVGVDLPARVQVGVALVNAATSPLSLAFRDYALSGEVVAARADPPPPRPPRSAAGAGHPLTGYDSPPKPVRITRPEYPAQAFADKLEGTVIVEVLIDSSGRVVRSRVVQSVPGLDEAALECTRQWEFTPAIKDGKPVPTIAHAPVQFRIY